MSESEVHRKLVNIVFNYAKTIVPAAYLQFLYCDTYDQERPSNVVGNFVPDVLYKYKDLLVIGEAKSYEDFERKHSNEQFEAYFKECTIFDGKTILVIGIPWELTFTAKNYFRRLKNHYGLDNAKVVILNEMGGSFFV